MDNRRKQKRKPVNSTAFVLVRTRSEKRLRRQLQRSLQMFHERGGERKGWRPHTHTPRARRVVMHNAWRGNRLH